MSDEITTKTKQVKWVEPSPSNSIFKIEDNTLKMVEPTRCCPIVLDAQVEKRVELGLLTLTLKIEVEILKTLSNQLSHAIDLDVQNRGQNSEDRQAYLAT